MASASAAAPPRRTLLANVALAIASPLVVLLVLEGLARLVGLEPPVMLRASASACTRHDPRYGYGFRPSCEGVLTGTPFRTNAAGLRGPALRDDGSTRLLVIGDSCTFGYHVAEDDAYPSVLQRLLDTRRGPGRYQVLNGGAVGYTSLHGLRFLEEHGMTLRPQLVVAAYMWNDAAAGPDVERQLDTPPPSPLVVAADDFLLEHSQLYRWVEGLVAQRAGGGVLPPMRRHKVPPDHYEANLRRIVQVARAGGARVALIDWGVGPRGYHDALARVAADEHLPVVRYDGPRMDLIHPTVEGHHALAEQLYAALDRAGYL